MQKILKIKILTLFLVSLFFLESAFSEESTEVLSQEAVSVESEAFFENEKAAASEGQDSFLAESEVPVLVSKKKEAVESGGSVMRLVYSMMVIALFAISLISFSKWWSKRNQKSNDTNKIRVLTQHYLGPKKSLVMIRVAGETVLIGVTDQNISMIKTLSLLDEEIPTDVPSSFKKSLQKASNPKNESEKLEADEFSFADIKDKVSQRIKEMRQI